jgi:hypothetical protein
MRSWVEAYGGRAFNYHPAMILTLVDTRLNTFTSGRYNGACTLEGNGVL